MDIVGLKLLSILMGFIFPQVKIFLPSLAWYCAIKLIANKTFLFLVVLKVYGYFGSALPA